MALNLQTAHPIAMKFGQNVRRGRIKACVFENLKSDDAFPRKPKIT